MVSEYDKNQKANAAARASKMHEQYQQGISLTEVGAMQDPPITGKRVHQILQKHGLPTRTSAETQNIKWSKTRDE